MATANSTTTGASPTTTPDHHTLSFVRVEHHGKRQQRLTTWFNVPAETYGAGNITGYKIAAEFMAWLKNQPSNYSTGLCVREVLKAAFEALEEPSQFDKPDRRGCAVTFTEAMTAFLMFAAIHCDHQSFLSAKAQRYADWARESAQSDIERNLATGQRLAAARAAKRAAKAMEAGAA